MIVGPHKVHYQIATNNYIAQPGRLRGFGEVNENSTTSVQLLTVMLITATQQWD